MSPDQTMVKPPHADKDGFVTIELSRPKAELVQPIQLEPSQPATAAPKQTQPVANSAVMKLPKLLPEVAQSAQSSKRNQANQKLSAAKDRAKQLAGTITTRAKKLVGTTTTTVLPKVTKLAQFTESKIGSAPPQPIMMTFFSIGAVLLIIAFLAIFFRPVVAMVVALIALVQFGMAGMVKMNS